MNTNHGDPAREHRDTTPPTTMADVLSRDCDCEGDAVRAMKDDHPEWFEQIREGLVIHPGDHLIISFPNVAAQQAEEIREEAQRRLGDDVKLSLVFGAEQLAVIRGDDQEARE